MIIHPKTITPYTESRQIDIEEFWHLAKNVEAEPFNTLRYLGKTANFALLFSAGARTFADTSLINLKIPEAAEIVDMLDLRDLQKKLVGKGKLSREDINDQYFLDRFTIATYIRNEFRKLYRGLVLLAERRRKEAQSKGYVRNEFGLVRRIPELFFGGKQDENYSVFSIAVNSPVQGLEFIIATYFLGYRLWKWLKDNNMKSRIFTYTHDSADMYIHKDEIADVLQKAKELSEESRPEYAGIKLTISGVISDYYGKGEIWKTGSPMQAYMKKKPEQNKSNKPKTILKKRITTV